MERGMTTAPRKILVLGAGFGGLTFCQTFRHANASGIVVDAQNHHLFQPLLYQVAAAGLSAPESAEPARSIVAQIRRSEVELAGGQVLAAENIIWAAGIAANSLAAQLGTECDRAGRVKVLPDLSLPGHPEVFVIGDLAAVADRAGRCR